MVTAGDADRDPADRTMTNTSFEELGTQRFVSLTTFRMSGAPVPTPVWIAVDGDALIVTTPKASGKVKRLRRNQDVELRPCGRTGRVEADSQFAAGRVTLLTDPGTRQRAHRILHRKYHLEYLLVMGVELLTRPRHRDRVILRITPT